MRPHRLTLILAVFLMALSGALTVAMTQSSLVWSKNLGAFEQHLFRRYNNPLFPKNRRAITQAEIDQARSRDVQDFKRVKEEYINLLEDVNRLPDNMPSSMVTPLRVRIEDIIGKSMGVGGEAYHIALEAKKLRRILIKSFAEAISNNPNAYRALQKAEAFYHFYAQTYHIPFIRQMLRKDSPIPKEEIVPALLMEEPKIIKSK